MPARSISRCETISASFGVYLRMGRKKRVSRMGCSGIVGREAVTETGLAGKIQGFYRRSQPLLERLAAFYRLF